MSGEYGRSIDTILSSGTNVDTLAEGQAAAAENLGNLEEAFGTIASIGDTSASSEKYKAALEKAGLSSNTDKNSAMQYIQSKMDIASRSFMTFQKMTERMQEMMMQVIQSLGKI